MRTGGDEFCSVLRSCDDEEMNCILKEIEDTLEEYNRSSGLPYKIGCSCGYYRMKAAETESIENVAAFADEEMYKVKVRKRL